MDIVYCIFEIITNDFIPPKTRKENDYSITLKNFTSVDTKIALTVNQTLYLLMA